MSNTSILGKVKNECYGAGLALPYRVTYLEMFVIRTSLVNLISNILCLKLEYNSSQTKRPDRGIA